MTNKLSTEGARQIEREFYLKKETFELLDLINAEFQSDPMSTQCFDSRIVQRVKSLVLEKKKLQAFPYALDN